MSRRALVHIGRIYTGDPIPDGQKRYGRNGMKLAPWVESVPVLVDHDEARRIGTVERLDIFDDASTGLWLTASCTLYPDAPAWIRKGTGASFGHKLTYRSSFVDGWLHGGYVEEVTVCREQVPREPLARVGLIYDEPEAKRAPRQYRSEDEELWDRVERLGEPIEQVIADLQGRFQQRKRGRSRRGTLVRTFPNAILGVR